MRLVAAHRLTRAEETVEEEKPFAGFDLFSARAVATLQQAGFIKPQQPP